MTLVSRLPAFVMLVLASALWSGAVVQGWRVSRVASYSPDAFIRTDAIDGDVIGDVTPAPLPANLLPWGGGDVARQLARQRLDRPIDQPELLGTWLESSLRERPLYAPTWLDQAELLAASGDRAGALRSIQIARALWPERAMLLRRASWLQVRLAPPDVALVGLLDYWAVAPADGLRTLALARRLEQNPEVLVEAAMPVWQRGLNEPLVYQAGLMDLARRAGDTALAQALWNRLDDASRAQETLLFPYLQILVAHERYRDADAVWEQALGAPPGLANGRFEEPMVPLGTDFRPGWATPGWRYQPVGEGFKIALETRSSDAEPPTLRIDFLGTHNVNFTHLSQVIRVHPGQTYRLSGYWSGEALTTRSGVFIELYTLEATPAVRVQSPPRWGTWAREPFDLEIQIPENALLIAMRVRRTATKALDHLLSGTVRLDTLELVPVAPQ